MIRFAIGFLAGCFTSAWLIGWLLSAQRPTPVAPEPYIAPANPDEQRHLTASYPWLAPQTTVTYS
ncbi:MAG: hypothetical protein IT341_10800 [Chloroflexi bacterium]|nr:hypothetical protein [Chloroflexota bacterium]